MSERNRHLQSVEEIFFLFHSGFLSRGHATTPCRVGRSVGPSVLNSERFLHYCSCPTVRDWIAVYPALFTLTPSHRIAGHFRVFGQREELPRRQKAEVQL